MARRRSSLFIKIDPQVTHMPQAAYVPPVSDTTDGAMTPELLKKLNEAGTQPQPSDAPPLADGAASPGTETSYSRADHVHPGAPIPAPSDADPLPPANTAQPGTSPDYSRADHRHPHDIGCCPTVNRGIVSDFDANFGDLVECDSSGGPFTVTLPPIDGGSEGKSVWIWVKPAPGGGPSPNAVTIDAHPSQFINLDPSTSLNVGGMQLISNGDNTWLRMY